MCIIAYAKQNVEFNANELINCWNNNPDGAGVMWKDEMGVHIKKGLMTLNDTLAVVLSLPKSTERVVHFRWATDGEVNKSNCHPFAVGDEYNTDTITNWAFAHNGILKDYLTGASAKYSDTMRMSFELLSKQNGKLSKKIKTYLENTGSKFIFFNSNQDTVNIGVTVTSPDSAVLYSNYGYTDSGYGYNYGYDDWNDCDYSPIAVELVDEDIIKANYADYLDDDQAKNWNLESIVRAYNDDMKRSGIFAMYVQLQGDWYFIYDKVDGY